MKIKINFSFFILNLVFLLSAVSGKELPIGFYESEYSFALKSKNDFIAIFRGFSIGNDTEFISFRNYLDDAQLFSSTCNYKIIKK